jgi:UDP-glucose 4-epimerase
MVLSKIGLTGATGMLGRHVYAAFELAGIDVVATSRSAGDDVAEWDLCKWLTHSELDALFSGVSAVIHAGASVKPSGEINEAGMFDSNVRACLNLGQWALIRNIPLIYISGAIVYEDSFAISQNELGATGWRGLGGFYGLSKLLAEDVMQRLRQQGLKIAILRPTSIYGKGLGEEKLAQRFLSLASKGEVINLFEPIQERVDLIHASDVARAIILIFKSDKWETFNLSSGRPISMLELANACIDATGKGRVTITGQPKSDCPPTTMYSLNHDHAYKALGWTPIVDIHLGLKMMLNDKYLIDR